MYSSTTLDGPSKSGCWKMLDYAEAAQQGADAMDSLFPLEYRSYLGQAAHAVLQYCAERRADSEEKIRAVAEEVGNTLIREGRAFRGRIEPPLPADDVWAGVDVAVQYLMARGLPLEAETVIPERDWTHPNIPYRALIDLVTVQDEGDEEYDRRVCEVTDYKSSWQAGEGELNTLQRWGQAVCVWRNLPADESIGDIEIQVDIIRQRVVNLRTWAEYTRDIHLDDPDEVAELEKWEKRIAELCRIADSTGSFHVGIEATEANKTRRAREANPGVGCLSCAWRHVCEDCWPLMLDHSDGVDTLARHLAIVEGQRSLLIKAIKAADIETPIAINGGWVGFEQKTKRVFRKGQEKHILSDWFEAMASELPEDLAPVLTSLLAALKPGKSNLDALAKALHPECVKGIGEIRADYVAGLTDELRYPQFGVWKDER